MTVHGKVELARRAGVSLPEIEEGRARLLHVGGERREAEPLAIGR